MQGHSDSLRCCIYKKPNNKNRSISFTLCSKSTASQIWSEERLRAALRRQAVERRRGIGKGRREEGRKEIERLSFFILYKHNDIIFLPTHLILGLQNRDNI